MNYKFFWNKVIFAWQLKIQIYLKFQILFRYLNIFSFHVFLCHNIHFWLWLKMINNIFSIDYNFCIFQILNETQNVLNLLKVITLNKIILVNIFKNARPPAFIQPTYIHLVCNFLSIFKLFLCLIKMKRNVIHSFNFFKKTENVFIK
jgi:hypothetical protein